MKEPKDIAMRGKRSGIHLGRAIAVSLKKLVAKSGGKLRRPVNAATVHYNNLGSRRARAQVTKKRLYH
jgi:hypothetical protein